MATLSGQNRLRPRSGIKTPFCLPRTPAPGHRKKYKLGQRRTRYEERVKRNEIVKDRQIETGRIMTKCTIVARAHCGLRESFGALYRVLLRTCQELRDRADFNASKK
jgi:hypothetical protein